MSIEDIKQWLMNNTDKYQINSDDDGELVNPFIYINDVGDIINDCIKDLMPAIQDDEWISVEDRYPEWGEWVIAATSILNFTTKTYDRESKELFYDGHNEDGHHWLSHGDWPSEVTHWKPLPKPPTK